MSNLNINYDQVVIQQNLVPYNDLKASGSYNRNLILPDDFFPTLSIPSVNQNGTPRWVQMDPNDNGVIVHVANGGGGGGGSPVDVQSCLFSKPGKTLLGPAQFGSSTIPCPQYLYAASWSLTPADTSTGTNNEAGFIGIYGFNSTKILYLGTTSYMRNAGAGMSSVCSQSVTYPNPINLLDYFGSDNLEGYYGGQMTVFVNLLLITSPT